MYDDQPLSPPESEEEHDAPRRRRGVTALWWLFLILVVIVLGVAAVAVLLSRDDDRQTAAETDPGADVIAGQVAGEESEDLSEEPAEAAPTESAELTAVPTPKPTVGPTSIPTVGPTSIPSVGPPSIPTVGPTATEPTESDDATRLDTGRIAIVDERSMLWTVAPDGTDQRLLSERGRSYQFPGWSPVGNDIAVIGNDFDSGGVYIVADEQDSEVRRLYSDRISLPIYLYWSPDGENVSFITNHPDGLALHLSPSDGLVAPQIVTTSPSTFFWDWMPDSSQVLVHTGFTARDGDNSRLAFVPLDGISEPAEIIENGFFQAPAVAANGRFFSYSDRDPNGNHWLSVRDIDQDQQVELIHHLGVVAMGFSPTTPRLAFTSPDIPELSFYGPLCLIDLDSGDSRILVPEEVMAFFWSPDGRSIATFSLATIDGPFRFEDGPVARLIDQELSVTITSTPDAANKRVLARMQSPPDQETRIGLSLSIVDVDSGDTRLLTTFEPSTVFFNQFLPFFDQYALSHRLWSPDSQALVLPMEDEQDRNFIVVVPVDGSEPLPIARGVAAFWSRQ